MHRIRHAQLEALRSLRAPELVEYVREEIAERGPDLAAALTPPELSNLVREAICTAARFDLSAYWDVAQFAMLRLRFGPSYAQHIDPAAPFAALDQ